MTVSQILKKASVILKDKSKRPLQDAEVLLSFLSGKNTAWLIAHQDETMPQTIIDKYYKMIRKRADLYPLHYITKKKGFFNCDFYITPDVLIPRPETESMIEEALKEFNDKQNLLIADVGTGSGCIAITSALEFKSPVVYAYDISKKALRVAQKNANVNKATGIVFEFSDLLDKAIKKHLKFDIIFANLPYLDQKDLNESPTFKELACEPELALITGENGLELIKKFIIQSAQCLKKKGTIHLEMLPRQILPVKKFIKKNLSEAQIHSYTDYNNVIRFLKIKY